MRARPWLAGNVVALGVVSLLTDASSEMVVPLLPLFVAGLGGGAVAIGVIEGAAEATAALLKLVSGRLADRSGRNKPLVVAGYGLSTLARPLVAVAAAPWHVLVVRVTDRVGKGVRSSPRDALLAASVAPEHRGRAFGAHRAMDHAGAVLGPLLALAALALASGDLPTVFALAALPGLAAMIVLVGFVRDTPAPPAPGPRLARPSPQLVRLLLPVGLFGLGNASDVFLLLLAGAEHAATWQLPLLWMAFHVVKVLASLLGGDLADRFDRRHTIAAGWVFYAAVYAAFAFADGPWAIAGLFVVYGVYHGLTEGAEKALVADLAPAGERGTAFGWYHLVVGAVALPASAGFGALWEVASPRAAFLTASALALVAVALLFALRPGAHAPRAA